MYAGQRPLLYRPTFNFGEKLVMRRRVCIMSLQIQAMIRTQRVNRRDAMYSPYVANMEKIMLYWALVFLVIAIVAAIFGFAGIAAGAASIAKIIFMVFLVLFVLSLIFGNIRRGGPRP
jgi:uncharacterized membrane protein YtjA (UPF0391 family)